MVLTQAELDQVTRKQYGSSDEISSWEKMADSLLAELMTEKSLRAMGIRNPSADLIARCLSFGFSAR